MAGPGGADGSDSLLVQNIHNNNLYNKKVTMEADLKKWPVKSMEAEGKWILKNNKKL